jgi:lipase chaperone LimK
VTQALEDAPYTLDDARNRRAWWSVAAAAVVACGVWGWVHFVQPAETGGTTPSGTAFPWNRSGDSGVAHPGSPASAARSGTDLALQVDAAGHLVVTRSVRNLFDSFLAAAGTTPLPTVRERIVAHLDARLPKAAASEARTLLDHYLAYGQALQDLGKSIDLQGNGADDRQARLYAIEDLRARHFSAPERQAFFGDDLALERYALSRQQTLQDSSIVPLDKARRLKQLRAELPAALQAGVSPSEVMLDVGALTRDWRARKGTPQELRALREELLGVQGADQLEAQERDSAAWKQQLQGFSAQRKALMNDPSLSDVQRQQAMERLRQQTLTELERQQMQGR